MQEDRRLFEEFIQNVDALPALRIYQVSKPSMTVGRVFAALRNEVAVCVRPTGGGLVRHGEDLIYSVIARRDSFPTFHQVRTSYLSFHEAVQLAFKTLGIETRLFRCDDPAAKKNSKEAFRLKECFRKPVPTDVAVGSQKIAGGAQWRRREGFLHQGSIQFLRGVTYEALKTALIDAFEKKFGIEFVRILTRTFEPSQPIDETNRPGYKRKMEV